MPYGIRSKPALQEEHAQADSAVFLKNATIISRQDATRLETENCRHAMRNINGNISNGAVMDAMEPPAEYALLAKADAKAEIAIKFAKPMEDGAQS